MNVSGFLSKFGRRVFLAAVLCSVAVIISSGAVQGTTSCNSNMLDINGNLVGGASDVVMSCEGAKLGGGADYTYPGITPIMTLSSDTRFLGKIYPRLF